MATLYDDVHDALEDLFEDDEIPVKQKINWLEDLQDEIEAMLLELGSDSGETNGQ